MKASELRIGNYLDYYGQVVIVLDLFRNNDAEFGYFNDSVGFKRKLTERHSPQPIPLTEEWLKKFGFSEKDKWFIKDKFLLGYMTCDQNLQAEWKFGGVDGAWNLINIRHVHQLQNIFHALTGEELTTN